VAITYDGSGRPEGIKVFYNGKPQGLNIETNAFKKNTIKNQVPFTIGSRSPGSPAHACGIAGLSVWGRALADGEIEGLARGQALADIVRLDPAARPAAAGPLYDWWLATADEPFKGATARAAALDAEQAEIRRRGTVAHVMNEKPEMAKAYVLARGEYDKRTDEVIPDTPEIRATGSASPAGCCWPITRSRVGRRSTASGRRSSAQAWCARAPTSASPANFRATRNSSTGWRSSSARPAGT
jgi:hypothetical protein